MDPNERIEHVVAMMKLVSEEVLLLTTYYNYDVLAHVIALQGPRPGGGSWNIHEWDWLP